ncbi:hypothetical protein [Salicibibacter kimchii]|uniref:DUF3955 domain-containing protein n=1 Tax=Salicibibacter kimchii TaxID=2099786 RepID=A0A345BUW4_9BACI|nr:hypothetical protein [Salicibibacter kimchii]AXF54745.1 hypothetical protein DT065_01055 [Salicibibacter kimchii]
MYLNKTIIAGIISIFIGMGFFLAVALLLPTGNESDWGYGMGGLTLAAIFGTGGILILIIGIVVRIIKRKE